MKPTGGALAQRPRGRDRVLRHPSGLSGTAGCGPAGQGLGYAGGTLYSFHAERASAAQKAAMERLRADWEEEDRLDKLAAELNGLETDSDEIPETGEREGDLVDQINRHAKAFLSGQLQGNSV